MFVWVSPVNGIFKRNIRHTTLDLYLHNLLVKIFSINLLKKLDMPLIYLNVEMSQNTLKLFTPQICQLVLIFTTNFVRIEQIPIFVIFYRLHKAISYYHLGKNIISFTSLITIFGLQLKKIFHIKVPTIQCDSDRPSSFPTLVEIKRNIINDTNIRYHSASPTERIANTRSLRTDPTNTHPNSTATRTDLTNLLKSMKNTVSIIVKSSDKTAGKITVRFTQID